MPSRLGRRVALRRGAHDLFLPLIVCRAHQRWLRGRQVTSRRLAVRVTEAETISSRAHLPASQRLICCIGVGRRRMAGVRDELAALPVRTKGCFPQIPCSATGTNSSFGEAAHVKRHDGRPADVDRHPVRELTKAELSTLTRDRAGATSSAGANAWRSRQPQGRAP